VGAGAPHLVPDDVLPLVLSYGRIRVSIRAKLSGVDRYDAKARATSDPLYAGELRARADLTLAAILRALLVVFPVVIIAGALGTSTMAEQLLLCATIPATLLLFVLQRRGHFALCVHLIVFGLIAFTAAMAALYGSIRGVGTVGMVAAITMGGIFLGRRALTLAAALSVAAIGALVYAENAGWLPAPDYSVSASHWAIYSIVIAAVALVLAYMRALLLSVVNRLGDEVGERRKAEASRRQSEERFRQVFESSPVGMTITRASDGVFLDINSADQRTLGYTREELIGRRTLEMGSWLSAEERTRFLAALRTNRMVRGYDTRMRNKAGEIVDCRIWADLVELDGEECVLSSTMNITEQERTQRQLELSQAKYAAVFATTPDAISIARAHDGVTLEVNDAWIRITGYTRDQALGRSALALGLWADPDERKAAMARLDAGGMIVNFPARFALSRGQTIDVLLSGAKLELGGEACIAWSWRDVTEQRKAEEARRQALQRFQLVFDHSPESITISRLSDGMLLAVNGTWLRSHDLTREQAVGRTTVELGLWGSEDREPFREKLVREGRVMNHLLSYRKPDGDIRETLVSLVIVDMEGEACVIGMGRDVSEQRRTEEELRGTWRLLETVIDAIPMSIFAKDVNSNYIMLNKRMADYFGKPKEEILRRHTSALPVPDKTRSKSLADDEWVFKNLRTLDQPATALVGPDGIPVYHHSTKLPLFDDAGKLIGLLGINRDITEQRRAESALRESEHRYRSLFQAATDCILVMDQAGTLLDINESGCRSLGYRRDELIGGPHTRILDDSKFARMLPRPPSVQVEHRTLRDEMEIRAKDGTLREVEFTASPLPDGNILAIVRDVSERRQHEKLLENIAKGISPQTGTDFFRTLVLALCRELPADMAFIGEIVAGGERVRTIACCDDGVLAKNFEYPLAGSPCTLAMERRGTVVHAQGVSEQFPDDAALARRGISGYAGTSLFDAEGKAIGILVALTRKPIERKEYFVSLLEIFAARAAAEVERARADAAVRELNLSLERRVRERTDELEIANGDLESFGYSVAHDLRGPLSSVIGFTDLLLTMETGRLSADGRKLLQEVDQGAARMDLLMDGLLEFSRLGRKSVSKTKVSMAQLVGTVIDEIHVEQPRKRTDFRIGALPEARCDPMLLRQVWKNLIGNAVKYSQHRKPAIVEIGYEDSSGAYFVRDNGAGFDMRFADRLFGVFKRLHDDAEFEGTGVGLAIVQRIVQRHGGEVRGEGEPGRGATFFFTLPPA